MEQGADKKSENEIIFEKDAAVTKSGQVSLPKDVADALGVKYGENRVRFTITKGGKVFIGKQPSFLESLEYAHAKLGNRQLEAIKRNAGKSVAEMKDEWAKSEKGKAYYKEKYGL